jgi:DNA repair protein RecN (Recombination protein N)
MLRELRIRDVAVIENVTVSFEPGLNVLTGETGAGKSILIDAILLVRGARAQGDAIRTGAESATVEAVFEVAGAPGVAEVLDGAGLPSDESGLVVVRRELARSGRHRAFVNDSPVTVGLLERLGDLLVEVHGQHEHHRLVQPGPQLEVLDRFADAEPLRERVADLFAKYRAAREAVERLRGAERDRAQRVDLLRFQVAELDAARLRPGEEEDLHAERRRRQHAERIAAGLAEAGALLVDGPDSAADRLGRATRVLRDLGRFDPAVAAPAEALDGAAAQLEEAILAIRARRSSAEPEPGRLEAIDDRLDALGRLKRKYGDSEEAMLAYRARAAEELDRLERHEEVLAGDARRLAELRGELAAACDALGDARRAAATRLAGLVARQLRELGMDRARFEVVLERVPEEAVSARGLERTEFRFSANPGEERRPLARVASGGELSRTMLAIQAVLASADRIPTMVFDEVDAGVGGDVAAAVADKLAAAARGRQVLCVTHLAPIAARADRHLRVVKTVRAGRTRATVEPLADGRARLDEVARMLGGSGEAALRHARELLGPAGRRRP